MAIYQTAINKPITTALIFVGIIVFGVFSSQNSLSTNSPLWTYRTSP